MPTFTDALADAAEMSEAMRGLAHATLGFEQPEHIYDVLGDLLSSARSLEQILGQLATANETFHDRATDDAGDAAAGRSDATATAAELRRAADLIGQAERRIDAASAAAGRIAWHPEPLPEPQRQRFINVVFLQGEEADRIIDTITLRGADRAIQDLAGYDYGAETVDAALENGYVYDEPPAGNLDKITTRDAYTLVYNPFLGHVGLYREHDALPDPVLLGLEDPPRHAAEPTATELAQPGPASSEGMTGSSRRERLGTPVVHRPTSAHQPAVRGLGR